MANFFKIVQKNLAGLGRTMSMVGLPGGSIVERVGKMVHGKSKRATPATATPAIPPSYSPPPVNIPPSVASSIPSYTPASTPASTLAGGKQNTMIYIAGGVVVLLIIFLVMKK